MDGGIGGGGGGIGSDTDTQGKVKPPKIGAWCELNLLCHHLDLADRTPVFGGHTVARTGRVATN